MPVALCFEAFIVISFFGFQVPVSAPFVSLLKFTDPVTAIARLAFKPPIPGESPIPGSSFAQDKKMPLA